ncbi:MAG: sigma-70 family RNA polymerase sigma factor [Puia sp.]|nr:sigma-70 family RNA polymerase sigma factor [Puia sp.]
MKAAAGQFSEAEILEGFKRGDRIILSWLYRQNYAAVRSFVLSNSGTDQDARDVFQEGILAAWNNLSKNRYESREGKGLESYLRKICRFRWLERTRSAAFRYSSAMDTESFSGEENDFRGDSGGKQLPSTDLLNDSDDSLNQLIRKEEIDQARQLLARLRERCRKILYLFYYRRLSMEEIASEMELTADSAKNQKYRCLNQLRELYYGNAE